MQARGNFFEVMPANGGGIAREALDHITGLFAVEHDAAHQPTSDDASARSGPDRCSMHSPAARRNRAKLSRRSDLAVAGRYALTRWAALIRYAGDGSLEINIDAAERSLGASTLVPSNGCSPAPTMAPTVSAALQPGRARQAQRRRSRGLADRAINRSADRQRATSPNWCLDRPPSLTRIPHPALAVIQTRIHELLQQHFGSIKPATNILVTIHLGARGMVGNWLCKHSCEIGKRTRH